jgi:ABC-2 type transport system permease protein
MLIYISAFYTVSANGIRILASSVMEFLAGALIPIPFFPEWVQRILYAFPFASMQNTPFLIYVGHMEPVQALKSIALQALWFAILLLIGRVLIRKAQKKVVMQGG